MFVRKALSGYITWFSLLKASWHTAVGNVTVQGLALVLSIVAARGLGRASFGQVSAIIAYFGWFMLVSNYATYAVLPGIRADNTLDDAAKSRACSTAFLITVAFSGFSAILGLILLPKFSKTIGIDSLPGPAKLYAVAFAMLQLRFMIDSINQAVGWLRQWSISNITASALPVLLVLAYRATGHRLYPMSYIHLLLLAAAISVLLTLTMFIGCMGGWRKVRPDPIFIRRIIWDGRGPWLLILANVLSVQGVKVVIAADLGSKSLALFEAILALSAWVLGIGLCVTIPAMSDWTKIVAAGNLSLLVKDLRRRQIGTGVVLTTAGVVTLIWPGPILKALYGPDFLAASTMLRMTGLIWLTGGLGGWYMFCLLSMGQPWRVAMPNIIPAILGFVLTVFFIKCTNLGVNGAMIAAVLQSIGWVVVYEFSFRRALFDKNSLL